MPQSQLAKKIEQKVPLTCVMGLGYVRLPEAVSFARACYRVIGVDNQPGTREPGECRVIV